MQCFYGALAVGTLLLLSICEAAGQGLGDPASPSGHLSASSRALFDAFLELPADHRPPARPYLLATPDRWENLRREVQQEPMSRHLEAFVARPFVTSPNRTPAAPARVVADLRRMRGVERHIRDLYVVVMSAAFLRGVAPHDVDISPALSWLEVAPQWPVWSGRPHTTREGLLHNDAELATAQALQALAVGYDSFAGDLTEPHRDLLEWRIRQLADWLAFVSEEGDIGWARDVGGNWSAVMHAGLGMSGLAVWEEEPRSRRWVRQALLRMLEHLDAQPPDGSYSEGVGYWHYGLINVLHFADCLKNTVGIDLLQHPALKRASRFPLHCLGPDACELVNFSDSHRLGEDRATSGAVARRFAAAYRDPALQWMVHRTSDEYQRPRQMWIYDILWYDPGLEPARPPAESVHYRDIGWALCRGGWEPDALLLAFKCSPRWFGHAHHDANSFVVLGYGGALAIDSGHTRYHYPEQGQFYVRTFAHNTIMVGGEEQQGDTSQVYEPRPLGEITRYESHEAYDLVEGEAAPAYPSGRVASFRRRMVLVKPDLVVLQDAIRLRKPASVTWFFHPDERLDLSGFPDRLGLLSNKARLDMRFIKHPEWTAEERIGYRWTGPSGSDENVERPYVAITSNAEATAFNMLAVLQPRYTGQPARSEYFYGDGVLDVKTRGYSVRIRAGDDVLEVVSAEPK